MYMILVSVSPCTRSVLPMSTGCFEKMSAHLSQRFFISSFVFLWTVKFVNLVFLWQLTSSGDVITSECFKRPSRYLFVLKMFFSDVGILMLTALLADMSGCLSVKLYTYI